MAQPAVADVRVSCPACGGPIHPIAGRCKHCRTDLVAVRGGATGAQGTLIQIGALGAPGPGARVAAPLVTPASPGARPLGLPVAAFATPPPVGFGPAVAIRPRRRWATRWPLLVAALAALAIVVSIAVLVLGGGDDRARRRRTLGPAPDRMQTDQLPTDPWAGRGTGSAVDPSHGQILPQPAAPDINPDPDPAPSPDDDDDDQGGVLGGTLGGSIGPPGAGATPVTTAEQFLTAALDVTCQRLTACWGDANATTICAQGRELLGGQAAGFAATLCPTLAPAEAQACLRQLATLPCPDQSASMNDLATMAYGLDPCMRACER